jgi:hypothetical protein
LADYGSYLQGAVASPWALAGIFLIFVAFLAQGQQIELQQQELKLQREESERQRVESEAQFKLAYKQAFESTFFQLLDFQNQIVSRIKTTRTANARDGAIIASVSAPLGGRECIKLWYNEFHSNYEEWSLQEVAMSMDSNTPPPPVTSVAEFYLQSFEPHMAELGHYFRHLLELLRFVKSSSMVDKQWYANLVFAQLSSHEIALLFYHCSSPGGSELRPLAVEFKLPRHMDIERYLDLKHVELYPKEVWGGAGAQAGKATSAETCASLTSAR